GPTAASFLSRYFQSAGTGEIGSGRASSKLPGQFAGHSLAISSGLTDADPRMTYRRDVCQFADDRLSPAQKVAFIHTLIGREMAEAGMFLERIEKYVASFSPAERQIPAVAVGPADIAHAETARGQ